MQSLIQNQMRNERTESDGGQTTALYKSSGKKQQHVRVQELCESRGGRPGLPVLTSLTVSVDVKQH